MPAFPCREDGKHFDNGAFRKRWRLDNHMISLTEFSKMTGDCCDFKFLRRSVDGKHLMRFQGETSFKLSSPFESDIHDSPLPIGCYLPA